MGSANCCESSKSCLNKEKEYNETEFTETLTKKNHFYNNDYYNKNNKDGFLYSSVIDSQCNAITSNKNPMYSSSYGNINNSKTKSLTKFNTNYNSKYESTNYIKRNYYLSNNFNINSYNNNICIKKIICIQSSVRKFILKCKFINSISREQHNLVNFFISENILCKINDIEFYVHPNVKEIEKLIKNRSGIFANKCIPEEFFSINIEHYESTRNLISNKFKLTNSIIKINYDSSEYSNILIKNVDNINNNSYNLPIMKYSIGMPCCYLYDRNYIDENNYYEEYNKLDDNKKKEKTKEMSYLANLALDINVQLGNSNIYNSHNKYLVNSIQFSNFSETIEHSNYLKTNKLNLNNDEKSVKLVLNLSRNLKNNANISNSISDKTTIKYIDTKLNKKDLNFKSLDFNKDNTFINKETVISPIPNIDLCNKSNFQIKNTLQNNENNLDNFKLQQNLSTNSFYLNYNKYCLDYSKLTGIYKGYWSIEKLKNGYGVLINSEGSKYEGTFRKGKLEGLGKYITVNKEVFEGSFVEGKISGYGIYISSEGNIYKGNWLNNNPNGLGEEYSTDSSYYNGDFLNGKKSGIGTFKWSDGSMYYGSVKDDMLNGCGTYKWIDGKTYRGEWKNNIMEGKGCLINTDGSKYEGSFYNNKKEGFGIYYFNSNKYYEGLWSNGKQHGKGKIVKNGIIEEDVWFEGKRIIEKKN